MELAEGRDEVALQSGSTGPRISRKDREDKDRPTPPWRMHRTCSVVQISAGLCRRVELSRLGDQEPEVAVAFLEGDQSVESEAQMQVAVSAIGWCAMIFPP